MLERCMTPRTARSRLARRVAHCASAMVLCSAVSAQTTSEPTAGCIGGSTTKRVVPPGVAVLCTKVYDLQGPCNGLDAVHALKISGFPPQADWRIKPWEAADITIRGIELAQYKGGRIEWAMAGNNSVPDIMLMLANGQNYGRAVFPP